MKRTMVLCLASAIVGAVASTIYQAMPTIGPAAAQEARSAPFRPVDVPPASRRTLPPAPPAGTLEDDLTPEERVNVAVYENVNRSVVNISTKVVRGESFFFSESPEEGAGSGSVVDARGH